MLTVQPAPAPTPGRPRRPTAATTAPANASAKERRAFGKALRAEVPLGSHADFRRPVAASDPLAPLVEQVAEFGETYADVTEGDHRQLSDAITAGQLPALLGT
jgi:hypothetical protein